MKPRGQKGQVSIPVNINSGGGAQALRGHVALRRRPLPPPPPSGVRGPAGGTRVWGAFRKPGRWNKDPWATCSANVLRLPERRRWQRSRAHTASSRAEAAPARGSGCKAQSRDKRAGESAGLTGEGPAGRDRAEQTKERRAGGCGERNLSAMA